MDELKNDNGEALRKCSMCKSVKLLEGNFEKNVKGNIMKTCNTCRNKYKCSHDECGFKSHAKTHLTKHINTVHLKLTPFECVECDSKFGQKSNLTTHINTVHLKLTPFECVECDSKFGTKGSLTSHINIVHLKLIPFVCVDCGHKCGTKSNLTQHIKVCTGKENISSGEYAVKNVLIDMKIKFEHNTSFEVKDKLPLRWDFICTLDTHPKLFIEYDGRQHYEPVKFGGISKERAEQNLVTSQHRDKIKNDFCRDNNYPLLRIKYDQFGDISKLLTEFFVKYGWGFE